MDLASLFTPADCRATEAATETVGIEENRTKPIFDHLEGKYD